MSDFASNSPTVKRIKLTLTQDYPRTPNSNSPLNSTIHPKQFTLQNINNPIHNSITPKLQTELLTNTLTLPLSNDPHIPITEKKARNAIQDTLSPNSILLQFWKVHSVVGWGGNGVILTASRKNSSSVSTKVMAIKIVYKTTRTGKRCFPISSQFHQLPSELKILASLPYHVGILKFHEWFEDDMFYYIVTDYVSIKEKPDKRITLSSELSLPMYSTSSDLFSYLDKHTPTKSFTKNLFIHLARTVYFLHSNGVSHGDIKEENILISSHTSPILCDFGHAHTEEKLYSLYGTTDMTAPELLQNTLRPKEEHVKSIGYPLDVWALGLTMFVCHGGQSPKDGVLDWSTLQRVPKGCMELLKGMLNVNPKLRFNMHQVVHHPYLFV